MDDKNLAYSPIRSIIRRYAAATAATFDDAVELAFEYDDPNAVPGYFNFDGDGDVDFEDAIELAFQM